MRAHRSAVSAAASAATAPAAAQTPLQSVLDAQAPAAQLIAALSGWMIAVAALVLAAVLLIVGLGLWRGRAAPHVLGANASRRLVIGGGVLVPLAVASALVVGSVRVDQGASQPDTAAALTVEVIGRQWWWELRYLDAADKPVATAANELHVPAGAAVRLLLRSADVIHTFWVPNLDGKTDMIPGMTNIAWLRAAAPGRYRGQCAEFCGTQHTFMALEVVVQPAPAFRAWLAAQARPAAEAALRHGDGRRLFTAKGCAECHSIRGTEAQGARGPDLTHLASRATLAAATVPNNRGHLAGWILDPHAIKPGALMPPTALLPGELDALLAYLEALR